MARIVIGTSMDPTKGLDEIAENESVAGTFLLSYEFNAHGSDPGLEKIGSALRDELRRHITAGGPLTRQSWLIVSDDQLERLFSDLIGVLGMAHHALTVVELNPGLTTATC